jgi:hypothetical protein
MVIKNETKYYRLDTPSNTFYAKFDIEKNNLDIETKIIFNLGACVTINVSCFENVAIIEQLYYDKSCNKYKTLQNKEGTLDMLHASMALIKRLYPRINGFRLRDASHKIGSNASLFHLYISLHGLTWYERYFKAKFVSTSKSDVNSYYNSLLKMIDSKYKKDISIELFENTIGKNISKPIKVIYNKSESFLVFFNSVLEYFENDYSKYADFIKPWIESFMFVFIFYRNFRLINEYYYIDSQDLYYLDNIDYEEIDKIPESEKNGCGSDRYELFYKYKLW